MPARLAIARLAAGASASSFTGQGASGPHRGGQRVIINDRQRRRSARKHHDPAYASLKTQPKPRLSTEQVQALREARASVREDYLEHMRPGFYHYVIIFIVASVAGLILEMVWMFVSSGR